MTNTDTTNEKAPGACDSAGHSTDNNSTDSATGTGSSKAIATLTAQLSIAGHTVHKMAGGEYLVCKYGHTYHAHDFAALQGFARRVGVRHD